jgi:hypothetical protein
MHLQELEEKSYLYNLEVTKAGGALTEAQTIRYHGLAAQVERTHSHGESTYEPKS